jgi:hypothetical protein
MVLPTIASLIEEGSMTVTTPPRPSAPDVIHDSGDPEALDALIEEARPPVTDVIHDSGEPEALDALIEEARRRTRRRRRGYAACALLAAAGALAYFGFANAGGGAPPPPPVAEGSGGGAAGVVTHAQYIAEANSICRAGNQRLIEEVTKIREKFDRPDAIEHFAVETMPAIRIWEEMLARLRALPVAAADRADYNDAYALFDRRIRMEREVVAAIAAGDPLPGGGSQLSPAQVTFHLGGMLGRLDIQECARMFPG